MKKILALIIILESLCTGVYAREISSYKEEIPISESITLTNVKSFYSDKNISYSYIVADLSDENTSLKLLTSQKGTDVLETVETLAKGDETVVSALNADFFSVHSGNKGFSLGVEIKDGELLQSPINPGTMATVSYMNDEILMSYLDFHIMAVAPNGNYQEVRHLNKHTSYYGDILMYTKDFNGGLSPAPGGEVVEVLVEDGKITEFRRNMPPVEIPENGCVLVVSEGVSMFFANNFEVGDEIKFDYYITPDIASADVAFGGGAMLVDKGAALTSFSHTVSGYQPRSAVGVDKYGTTLYLVAVDGRQESSRGMTMSELADLMVSLGCYQAVNLDGGGSTNMLASTVWNKDMHKVNSATENRKVINALGLTYTKKGKTTKEVLLTADKDVVFIGEPVKLNAAAYDEYKRPVDKEISLSSKDGDIINGTFVPKKSGKTTITATLDRVQKSVEIFVIDKVMGINTASHIEFEVGQKKDLGIRVFDDAGHYATVGDASKFEITSSAPEVAEVRGTEVFANKPGKAIITIKKDNAVSYTSVVVNDKDAKTKFDAVEMNKYDFLSDDVKGQLVIGAKSEGRGNLIERLINDRVEKEILQAPNGFFLGDSEGFSKSEDENALYIHLDTKKGGIRDTDSKQWDNLVSAIEQSTKDKVFILANDPIFGKSEFENKVLVEFLSGLSKQVYVVSRGNSNTYEKIGDVNYFTIGTADEHLSMLHLENQRCLVFDIGETVTFSWKRIY